MKEGWQMNRRWKEGDIIIELFKTTRASMKFDRMIPSGSSWLMGVKVQRVIDQAHAVIDYMILPVISLFLLRSNNSIM